MGQDRAILIMTDQYSCIWYDTLIGIIFKDRG